MGIYMSRSRPRVNGELRGNVTLQCALVAAIINSLHLCQWSLTTSILFHLFYSRSVQCNSLQPSWTIHFVSESSYLTELCWNEILIRPHIHPCISSYSSLLISPELIFENNWIGENIIFIWMARGFFLSTCPCGK